MASGDDTLPSDPEADSVLPMRFGRYDVLGQLGVGGAGIVLAAYDPALHRKVALKVLRPRTATSDGDTRLAFEAQAMAQLQHPNVVTVFEIDRVGDQVYVAMELVEGTTLRGWMREPHGWRVIVETFVAAGRGLAAAHAAGLVHRDFKPDNVLIGSDGRPRVSDFGLVVHSADEADRGPESDELITDVSFRGNVVGTPAYMSAEQWDGRALDARSDQFAFCVTLWEALWGERPFAGERVAELRTAVRSAVIRTPAARRAPRWLEAVLRRGLAADPAARWPDMATLLARLERGLRRRQATAVVASAVAVAAIAVAIAAVESRRVPDPCAPPAERIAGAWNPGRGELLRLRVALVDPVEGASRYARIAGALDTGARRWSDMHVEACRATRVEGRQSDTLLDRRMTCLDRWLGELGQTVTAIEQVGDRGAVDQAVHAVNALSPLEACADARALNDALPPASAADRATAAVLARQIAEVEVAQRAGRLDGLPDRARDLVAAARALGHGPTLSAAIAAQTRVLWAMGDEQATVPILRELVLVAARAHADRDEAFAWSNLVLLVAENGKLEEGLGLMPSANAAVLRAGDPPDLRADLLYHEASAIGFGPKAEEARPKLEQARQLLEKAGPTFAGRIGDVLFELGTSYVRSGELDAGIASYHEAIERWRAAYGNDSVDEAFGWQNLGASLIHAGKIADARAAYDQAVRIREARLGDSQALAISLVGLASVFDQEARWDRSLALYERALAIDRAKLTPGDLHLVNPLVGSAIVLANLGRLDEAARRYDEAIGLFERTGAKTLNLAIALANRAHLAARRGHCDDAVRDDTRAIAVFETLAEPDSRWLIYPLVDHAACLINGGHPRDAIPLLERAVHCKADPGVADDVARARGFLGRALFETGRDRAGGLAMVRAARPAIAGNAEAADELHALDRWLAAHPR